MADEKPTVSVVLPTYNRVHLIGRSIVFITGATTVFIDLNPLE